VTARRRTDGGFTLLEVIVAMAIFAAGIVVVSRLLSGALRLAAGSRDASESMIYARQRMEEALLAPRPSAGKEEGAFGEKYRWELTTDIVPKEAAAEEEEGEPEETYDEIRFRVTIRWMDGGDERSVDLDATRWMRRETNEDT
jgi:type II secretion system protein I